MDAAVFPPDERRAWPRQPHQLRVLIHDPEDGLDDPYLGWIVDHSAGGICLVCNVRDLTIGDVLWIHPAWIPDRQRGVEVRVKNWRRCGKGLELGCEFVQAQMAEKLLGLEPKGDAADGPPSTGSPSRQSA